MIDKDLFQIAEVKLIYKSRVPAKLRPQVRCSRDGFNLLVKNWSDQIELVEEFYILLLNRASQVMGMCHIAKGGESSIHFDIKQIFMVALKARACNVILAHSHPSGNTQPSKSDFELTKKVVQAGEILDITILDHLIITRTDYYSFADEGEL